MTADPSPLVSSPDVYALAPEALREIGYRAVDTVVDHLTGLADGPVYRPMTDDERRVLLDQSLPVLGTEPAEVLERFRRDILAHPMGNGHPRFFAWVNSAPAPMGIIGDLLASAMNPGCAGGDHAGVLVERCVLRWLMELVGFPTDGSMGILVSGGSTGTLTCLAAARHRASLEDGWDDRVDGLQEAGSHFVLYASQEAHAAVRKSAQLLGLGDRAVRVIPVEADFRLSVETLARAIAADRAEGLRPFCVVATAGTTNTGAIDPLDEIADVCGSERLWLHVDGAYGALGRLDPDIAPLYRGLERADSLVLDPHKWLGVPLECGAAIVRDGAMLRSTFSLVPPYLRTEEGAGIAVLPWLSEYGFQQSRRFNALKVWMTLLEAGREGVAQLVRRHRALARSLATLVDETPDLERLAPVTLSTVCFRVVPPGLRGDDGRLDAFNRELANRVREDGSTFLATTTVAGREALRACILHHGTTPEDVDTLVATVRRLAAELLADSTGARYETIPVSGIHCPDCPARIDAALANVEGLLFEAAAGDGTLHLTVERDQAQEVNRSVAERLARLGFGADGGRGAE